MFRTALLTIGPLPRGFHLITREVHAALPPLQGSGLLHVFIRHTSAGLALNEGADPSVLRDFERVFNHLVPEDLPFLEHTTEGPDDMPAHVKAVWVGHAVTVPIVDGRLALGKWQGIYLCEFRNKGGIRHLVMTVIGAIPG